MISTIPPLIYQLNVLRDALLSPDRSFSRVNVVIATQIAMHISIICATVPCIKPFLSLFNTRTTSLQLKRPLLPFHRSFRSSRGSDGSGRSRKKDMKGRQPRGLTKSKRPSYRRNESSAKWKDQVRMTTSETVTTIEHVPPEAMAPVKRRSVSGVSASSRSDSSSNGIELSRSFAVHYEDLSPKSSASSEFRPGALRRSSTQPCSPAAFEPSSSRDRAR